MIVHIHLYYRYSFSHVEYFIVEQVLEREISRLAEKEVFLSIGSRVLEIEFITISKKHFHIWSAFEKSHGSLLKVEVGIILLLY